MPMFDRLLGVRSSAWHQVQEVNVIWAVVERNKAEANLQNKTNALNSALRKLDDKAGGASRSVSSNAREILVDAPD